MGKPRIDPTSDRLLTSAQLADRLGLTTRSIRAMVSSGRIPGPFLRIGDSPRWRAVDFEEWLASKQGQQV